MSSLEWDKSLNRTILLDKVVDLSSWKIESIFQIGLSNSKRNHFFFFFGGGGGGFWIPVGSQRNFQRTFIGENRFASLPSFLE